MESYEYKCDNCGNKFIPTRRGVQRFCKPSCRTRSHQKKKQLQSQLAIAESTPNSNQAEVVVHGDVSNIKKEEKHSLVVPTDQTKKRPEKEMQKIEKMSAAGIGNVVVGNAFYDLAKGISKLGQKDENKLATNGNLWKLYDMLKQNQQLIIDLILKQEKEFKADDFI